MRIYAFGDVEGQPYLAMEYVEGETLADRILRLGRLPVEEAARFMREILLALDAAWEKGIVHRDIKPSNVLLDRRGRIRVADFGLAKAAQVEGSGAALTQDGLIVGTPYYISPEQAQGQPADFRSDIYSCGILFYEMLVGEKPFEGTTPIAIVAKHLHEALPSIRAKRPDIPNRVALLIERMTEKDPSRRPVSYSELIGSFEALLGITPAKPISATETFSAIPSPRRRIAVVPLVMVAIIIVIAALLSIQMFRVSRVKKEMSAPPSEKRLVVAVTPFYGPDDDSAKEGRMMAALVERSIASRLGADNVKVIGIDETKEPLRSHEAARALGDRVGAAVVVWGEAFALKNETEIQPYFTMVRREAPADSTSDSSKETAPAVDLKSSDPVAELSEQTAGITRVEAEAPNQIELRKTSADGVGEMVSFLAGLHALYTLHQPEKALQFFDQAPKTADTLRHRAQAYLRMNDQANATKTLEAALELDPKNAGGHAALADLYLVADRFQDAVSHYGIAASSGEPYRTSYAILDGGLLFVREVYRHPEFTSGEVADTGYLLTVGPDSGVVKSRIRLPGAIRSFAPKENGFTVTYAADRDEKQIESVDFIDGRSVRPLPIGGSFLLRMRGMKMAWALAENFTQESSGIIEQQAAHPRFRLQAKPVDRAPKSLPELEGALRAASSHDPTQPWHLFWLAETLLAEERKPEAEAVMNQLIALESGAIYSNYNFMGKWAERFGQRPWADRLYDKALRDRKRIPQPIQFTTLIERLINVAFMRIHAEQKKDAERSYLLLRRAREISGPTEADQYAAAAWAGHFRRKGDLVRARAEEQYARLAAHHPFNFISHATYVDYALSLLVASSFGLAASAIVLLVPRGGRRRVWWREVVNDAMALVPRRWLAVTIAFLSGGVMITIAGAFAGLWPHYVVLIFLTITALYATSRRVVAPTLASLRKNARHVLLVAFLVWLVIALGVGMALNRISRLAELPLGVADSFGHPVIVAELEKRLTEDRTPELIYATAVANDLGGNRERAKALYGELPGNPRAQRALLAFGRGESDVTMPGAAELFSAFTAGTRPVPLRQLPFDTLPFNAGQLNLGRISIVVVAAGMILGCLVVPPAASPANPPRPATRRGRVARKTAYFVLPGAFDLRRGSSVRGVVMMTLLGFTLYLTVVMWKAFPVLCSPGIVTAISLPNVMASSPFPPDWSNRDLMFAPPFAPIFWSIALVSVVTLLVLHSMRIPAIRALYRDDDASEDTVPTLITPAPTSRE